jgi:hypothetical protein
MRVRLSDKDRTFKLTFCAAAIALDNVLYLFLCCLMDWNGAIEINKAALAKILAGLVALLAACDGAARIPVGVYQAVARVLMPAESAVRRLIVIAARGVVVKPVVSRPMPKGLVIAGKGTGRRAFQLFDTRKNFSDAATKTTRITGPRIRVVDMDDPRSQFMAKINPRPDGRCSVSETLHLTRRLEAVKRALENLPRQVQRLVRWQARRAAMENPKFVRPLRPGPPPGNRRRGKDDIDKILRECHALAWAALNENTS